MNGARVKAALRPYLPDDAPVLAAIFCASIQTLTADDYSERQQAAWMAQAADEPAFAHRLASQLTLVATLAGEAVGFVSLKGGDEIDLLYVHPDAAGQGVACMLCEAVEKLAAARGAKRLTVDASDTALGFFQKRGYTAEQRNTVPVQDEWLGNTTMRKRLAPDEKATLQ